MSVDVQRVKEVARLARIAITDQEAQELTGDMNEILGWVEQLDNVDITNVEPMTAVVDTKIKLRSDEISDGNYADKIVSNAPKFEDDFFMVPKVIE